MIKLNVVSFKYDKEDILDKVNLEIKKNKVTVILGTNGAGKSTLANLLSGLIYPSRGEILLDDLVLNKKVDNKIVRQKIGIIFQNPSNQIIFSKVYDDIKFTLENMQFNKDDISSIIEISLKKVKMAEFINANPYNLSGGQKQRIAIASAIAVKPDYLVFDEATSMIDPKGKKDIYNLINDLKKQMGIIFITNNINELVIADEVIILNNKKAYKYDINDIIKDNSILLKYNLEIPFIFKIASKLNLHNIKDINENKILAKIGEL